MIEHWHGPQWVMITYLVLTACLPFMLKSVGAYELLMEKIEDNDRKRTFTNRVISKNILRIMFIYFLWWEGFWS
jgi:hypothetical protein